ncbi:MAG: lysophospholipid acyltransferase family protein [Anaerolineae bacterium]
MRLQKRLVLTITKALIELTCRVDKSQLSRVPMHGPLIIIANHINFLEVPVMYVYMQPRMVTGFAKAENWNHHFTRWLLNLCEAIPLERGEADMEAIHAALAALEEGRILAIAPEGTRSYHGRLQKGRPGTAMLALHSGAPILPLVYYGGEKLKENLRRLRRTDFHIVVGEPFHIDTGGARVTRHIRQHITDEMMYQLSTLLPPEYRGVYANLDAATTTYLRFASATGTSG